MSYYSNPYYNPQALGLAIVESVDLASCYAFDIHCLWRHESGIHYYAQDSGCSCPTPFENFNSLDDLEVVTRQTYDRLWQENKGNHEMQEFLQAMLQAVNGR